MHFYLIVCSFYICRVIKVPGVQKGVEKALQKKGSDTSLEEPPDTLLEDDSEVKLLIVPQNIPTENFTEAGVCTVEMKPLTFRPASTTPTPTPRLQTARRRKPFIQPGVTRSGTRIHKLDKESGKTSKS